MLTETLGFDRVPSATMYGAYLREGLDIFVELTRDLDISLQDLYSLYHLSDYEGLAMRVGQHLRGWELPLIRGHRLFSAIHRVDRDEIEALGVNGLTFQE